MKRQFVKTMQRFAALALGVLLTLGNVAHAVDNTAIGDVAGSDPALDDSNTFTLTTFTPELQKRAFLTVGNTALATNDVLPAGTSVDFLIYLNNEGSVDILDVGIQDTLVAGFTYVATSIRVLNTTNECAISVCTAPEELTIYNDVRATGFLSDGAGDDVASSIAAVVEIGNNGVQTTNATQNALANEVLAVFFTAILN